MAERDDDDAQVPPDNAAAAHNSKQRNEPVGYGRPPKHSQFKKGRSGNPKGRPKGSKNLSTLIDQEMRQTVTATENGTRKKITKKEAIAKRLVNAAAGGDAKMITLLLNRDGLQSDPRMGPIGAEVTLGPEDTLVMANLLKRIRAAEPPTDDNTATGEIADQLKAPQD